MPKRILSANLAAAFYGLYRGSLADVFADRNGVAKLQELGNDGRHRGRASLRRPGDWIESFASPGTLGALDAIDGAIEQIELF